MSSTIIFEASTKTDSPARNCIVKGRVASERREERKEMRRASAMSPFRKETKNAVAAALGEEKATSTPMKVIAPRSLNGMERRGSRSRTKRRSETICSFLTLMNFLSSFKVEKNIRIARKGFR